MPDGAVDIVIRNAKVVTPNGVIAGGVAVKNGKIIGLGEDLALPTAKELINAEGNYLLPGLIDPHTHLGGIERTFAEDIQTETRSAAAGGITSLLTIENPDQLARQKKPPGQSASVSFKETFSEGKDIIDHESFIDVGLTFAITRDAQALEIPHYVGQFGVTSFKLFLSYRDPEIIAAIMLRPMKSHTDKFDDGLVYLAMEKAAEAGAVVAVHAESWEVSRVLQPRLMQAGAAGLRAWADKSPGFVEAMDVRKVALLSQVTGCCVYIVHITAKEALEEVRKAKRDGVNMIGETCPHYLGLIDVDAPFPGSLAKVNPPVRDREHSAKLWEGIKDRTIECIGSDHINFMLGNRKPDSDIWHSGAAFPGMELTLPLMYTAGVDKGKISLQKLAEICSTNTAKTFGLYPQKGAIQTGADADMVMLNTEQVKKVACKELHQFSDFSIYEGMELKGWPVLTMLRGHIIMKDGHPVGEPKGKYLNRK